LHAREEGGREEKEGGREGRDEGGTEGAKERMGGETRRERETLREFAPGR
jgi:hypothetical protein